MSVERSDLFRNRDSNSSSVTAESLASEHGVARTVSAGGTPRTVYVETRSKVFAHSSFGDVFDINMEGVAATVQRGPSKSIERAIEKVQPPVPHMLQCFPQPPTASLRSTVHTAATRGF
jgi:hypothetical protein